MYKCELSDAIRPENLGIRHIDLSPECLTKVCHWIIKIFTCFISFHEHARSWSEFETLQKKNK